MSMAATNTALLKPISHLSEISNRPYQPNEPFTCSLSLESRTCKNILKAGISYKCPSSPNLSLRSIFPSTQDFQMLSFSASSVISFKCFPELNSDAFWTKHKSNRTLGRNNSRERQLRIYSHATEAMEEATSSDNQSFNSYEFVKAFRNDPGLAQHLKHIDVPKSRTDDSSLNNPLLRMHRIGCGWLAVIFEWEGVIVEDDVEIERRAWSALAQEIGKAQPIAFVLKRIDGMKKEQAIAEVLCWSRDFPKMRKLAARHEEIYQQMQGGCYRLRPGAKEFIETLKKFKVPIAMASTRPRKSLERAIEAVGLEGCFDVVLASEDVYRGKPDPEMFEYAAQKLEFVHERCIVIGNSNTTVEAAHDAYMKCIAVAGKHPVYELGAADLVVRRLNDLSMVDLKDLADVESPEFFPPEPIPELEYEPETSPVTKPVATQMNWF